MKNDTEFSYGSEANHTNNPNQQNSIKTDDAISRFFQRWPSLSSENSDCVPDAELLSVAAEPNRSKWPEHIKSCTRCSEVIQLLQNSDRTRISIDDFLSNTSRVANKGLVRSTTFSFNYINAFYRNIRPSYRLTGLMALAVLFSVSTWFYLSRSLNDSTPITQRISLSEDGYWKTTQWLRMSSDILEDESLSPEDKLTRLKPLQSDFAQVKQTLANIRTSDLDPTRRAELAELVINYNSQAQILRDSILIPKKASQGTTHIQSVDPTKDSTLVSEIYAAVKPTNIKNEAKLNQEQKQLEAAKAIVEASKQLDFTSIKDNEVEVRDLVTDRNTADRARIQERMTQLQNNTGVTVKLSWSLNNVPATIGNSTTDSPKAVRWREAGSKRQRNH